MQSTCNNTAMTGSIRGMYLYFAIDNEIYGIEAHHVLHITGMRHLKKFPKMPNGMLGLLNLRGSTIPVYSLHARFGKEKPDYSKQTRLIVIWIDGAPLGLIVDSIQEIAKDETYSTPNNKTCRYVSGITQLKEEHTVLLLTRIAELHSTL